MTKNQRKSSRALIALMLSAMMMLTGCFGLFAMAEGGGIVTLYIGQLGDRTVEAAVTGPFAPETLIAALAEETGWNLNLASVSETDAGVVVALAPESSLYVGPPDPQNPDYQVFDGEDLVLTILNSINATLSNNGFFPVFFTAPDGGDLIGETSGFAYDIRKDEAWGYADTGIRTYMDNVKEFVVPLLALFYEEKPYDTETTSNEYAADYLFQYANRYYLDKAETYPSIESGYAQYIAFPQDDVTQILNVAFGPKFSTETLDTIALEDQRVIYNGGAYYVGVDVIQTEITFESLDSQSDYQLDYSYELVYPGDFRSGNVQVTLQPSDLNQLGVSITSFNIVE